MGCQRPSNKYSTELYQVTKTLIYSIHKYANEGRCFHFNERRGRIALWKLLRNLDKFTRIFKKICLLFRSGPGIQQKSKNDFHFIFQKKLIMIFLIKMRSQYTNCLINDPLRLVIIILIPSILWLIYESSVEQLNDGNVNLRLIGIHYIQDLDYGCFYYVQLWVFCYDRLPLAEHIQIL